jgi:hypothetical protein
MKLITLDDLKIAAYVYLVIYKNDDVRQYLKALEDWHLQRGIKTKPFEAFQKVGQLLEKIYYGENALKK